jgi:crotonobetainyl-CoA:carnitine CoA-transferase CaiB-like acyl-CoA transferase
MSMLSGYRVLDLADERGALCGRLFADFGAEVIAVEPPDGNPARRVPPLGRNGESLFWTAYAAGKRSLVLDLTTDGGRADFKRLVATADFLVESYAPGYLDGLGLGFGALSRVNPRLILVSITSYGQTGPYAGYAASDLTLWSMGGHAYLCGEPDRPPVRVTAAPQAWLHAGAEALVGALVAHHWRTRSGLGQWVDVSAQECVVWTTPPAIGYPQPGFGGTFVRRNGANRGTPGGVYTRGVYPCKDGFIAIVVVGGPIGARSLRALVRLMDADGYADDNLRTKDWDTWDFSVLARDLEAGRREIAAVEAKFAAWFLTKTMEQLYDFAIHESILLAPVYTPREILRSPQLAARDYWRTVETGASGALRFPGAYIKASTAPLAPPRPAPRLGEAKIQDLTPRPPSLRGKGVPWSGTSDEPEARDAIGASEVGTPFPRREGGRGVRSAPLAGIKVADFAWVGVGPLSSKYLADHGATVIRIESSTRAETLRHSSPFFEGKPGLNRSHFFNNFNTSKLGITLDMTKPGALAVAERLIRWADVVTDSYTPGTMRKWGVGYERVRELNPSAIMLSTTQQGQTGPHAGFGGYGSLLQAVAGFSSMVGWPDRPPVGAYTAYTDFICHHLGGAALLAALEHRRRTGQGQHLDLAQFEGALHFLAPYLLHFQATGEVLARNGNRDLRAVPHGVFPCVGTGPTGADDRWLAMAIWDDAAWSRLAELIGAPWAADARLQTAEGRRAHEDALEDHLAGWTREQDACALLERLQAEQIDAGVVQTVADLYRDPQLMHRGHFVTLEHAEIGPMQVDGLAFHLSATPGHLRNASPCIGQDNAYVYREILGYSDDEIADFIVEGVIN